MRTIGVLGGGSKMRGRRSRSEIDNQLTANNDKLERLRGLLNSINKNPIAIETLKIKYKIYNNICDLAIRQSNETLRIFDLFFTSSQKRILEREINDINDMKKRLNDIQSGLPSPVPDDKVSMDIILQLRKNKEDLKYIVENLNAVEKDRSKLANFKIMVKTYINTCENSKRYTQELFKDKSAQSQGDERAVKRELEDIDDLIADLKAQGKKELSADEGINPQTEEPTSPRQSNR